MNPQPKRKRIKLSYKKYKELEIKVLERDNCTCQECFCYTEAPPHHIIFRSQGGDDTMENLQTLCVSCHERKHR
jgi:5-methylcytosine-specific restriction endonuclease McrA